MATWLRNHLSRGVFRLLLSPALVLLLSYHLLFSVYLHLVKCYRRTEMFRGCES
ncbi:MAG: hypothetical protein V2A70_04630 [Candidatus Omnitrophota bacterium]